MADSSAVTFATWLEQQNGTLDKSSMGIVDFPGQGRGAIALKDIPVRRLSSPRSFRVGFHADL